MLVELVYIISFLVPSGHTVAPAVYIVLGFFLLDGVYASPLNI